MTPLPSNLAELSELARRIDEDAEAVRTEAREKLDDRREKIRTNLGERMDRLESNLEKAQVSDLEATSFSESANTTDDAAFLEECLEGLAPAARKLVEERYARGLSNEELAVLMGRTAEWVRVTLFRVRRQLRECIEAKSGGTAYGV